MSGQLQVEKLSVSYGKTCVIQEVDLEILQGKMTAIIGPNGSGKSTFLKAVLNLIPKAQGQVMLDSSDLSKMSKKKLAQQISFLEQTSVAPDEMTLFQLVKLGRYSYQSMFQQWQKSDEDAVRYAMELVGLWDIKQQRICEVSGGQLQRAWFAMTVAQDANILFLDEPINHLDMTYQLECLEMLSHLNKQGKTVLMVLHDVNLAARYVHHLVVMKAGKIYEQGTPKQVMTEDMFARVFELECSVIENPISLTPLFIPQKRLSNKAN